MSGESTTSRAIWCMKTETRTLAEKTFSSYEDAWNHSMYVVEGEPHNWIVLPPWQCKHKHGRFMKITMSNPNG